MNIWIATPSGNRLAVVTEMIKSWKNCGVKTAIISWDANTIKAKSDYFKLLDRRLSWGSNQNILLDSIPSDWDVCIAACDDHFPVKNINLIEKAAKRFPDFVFSPNEGHLALCFPIITRGWYDKHRPIFDETYIHNCVDYDIAQQAIAEKKYVNCPQILFEHRSIEPVGYINEAHNGSNFEIDKKRYVSKWQGQPYAPIPIQVKDL
jgi:hypothetical protein